MAGVIFNNGMELDIYIPSLRIGIEYDGIYHKDKKSDEKKYQVCKNNEIKLIRVSEIERENPNDLCDYMFYTNGGFEKTLKQLLEAIGVQKVDININRDRLAIYSQYLSKLKENSLAVQFPDIAAEWNSEKNEGLQPEMFNWGVGIDVWWRCNNGHEWKATIASRTCNRTGCPICARKKVKAGQIKSHLKGGMNSLLKLCPVLVKEWNFEKNDQIDISTITPHSNQSVWWRCEKGHEWKAVVNSRTSGVGCPYCANHTVIPGENDLFSLFPDIKKIWNFDRNIDLSPNSIAAHSNKKAWWICEKRHEWQATISSVVLGRRCPYCSGKKVFLGYNDLATLRPDLLKEWDFDRNTDFIPQQVTVHSGRKAWWRCNNGHSWYAVIDSRSKGAGCPECASKKKGVINTDTGEIFQSMIDAAKSCGLKSSNSIASCCQGKQAMAGGFHWKYI